MSANFFILFLVFFQASAKRSFDETVEAHVNLGIDPKRSDQVSRKLLKEYS